MKLEFILTVIGAVLVVFVAPFFIIPFLLVIGAIGAVNMMKPRE